LRPEAKAYRSVVYHNYPALGLSLEYRKTVNQDVLDAIHVYNRHEKHKSYTTSFSSYPDLPITLRQPEGSNTGEILINAAMTAKDFVQAFGEPARKGGGNGPTSGSINIWCEWSSSGIMVEFGGQESRGHDAWDRGKDAVWMELTIFEPPK